MDPPSEAGGSGDAPAADAPGSEPGTDEHGSPAVDPDAVEATLDGIEATLDRVEAAIARVDEGTYGTCATCGQPIGRDRLGTHPTTTTCAEHDQHGLDGSTTDA